MINEELVQKELVFAERLANIGISEIRRFVEKKIQQFEAVSKKAVAKSAKKPKPTPSHGKMTLKELQRQNGALSTVELKAPHLRLLKSTLNKHGIDFSIVKDGKGLYTLFFKGKDADTVTHAFKQYTQKIVKLDKNKKSINKELTEAKEIAKSLNAGRDKEKNKSRGAR